LRQLIPEAARLLRILKGGVKRGKSVTFGIVNGKNRAIFSRVCSKRLLTLLLKRNFASQI
jgi:hypothetical protein